MLNLSQLKYSPSKVEHLSKLTLTHSRSNESKPPILVTYPLLLYCQQNTTYSETSTFSYIRGPTTGDILKPELQLSVKGLWNNYRACISPSKPLLKYLLTCRAAVTTEQPCSDSKYCESSARGVCSRFCWGWRWHWESWRLKWCWVIYTANLQFTGERHSIHTAAVRLLSRIFNEGYKGHMDDI